MKPAFLVASVIVLLTPVVGRPATFTVNDPADLVDVAPGDGVCASGVPSCTLRAAVQEANALAGRDTIQVAPGTYVLAIAGAGEDAAATGDLDVLDDLDLLGGGAVVDGAGLDRVVDVVAGDVTLSELTLQGGVADVVPPVTEEVGGGVLNRATLHADGLTVRDNTSIFGAGLANVGIATITNSLADGNHGVHGGGLYNFDTGFMEVTDTVVSANTGLGGTGGGVENAGVMVLRRLVVDGNTSDGGAGGGIYNGSESATVAELTLEDSVITGNAADVGGGFNNGSVNGPVHAAGIAVVVRTAFAANDASDGGGVANSSLSTLTMQEISVEGSTATRGAGIYNDEGCTLRVLGSTIEDNASTGRGAIYNEDDATLSLVNSTVSGNVNTGLFVEDSIARLHSVTIADNSEYGVRNASGEVYLRNSVLSGNTPEECGPGDTELTPEGPLVIGVDGCLGEDFEYVLEGVDAQLAPLAANGGLGRTHLPRPASPTIEFGDPLGCIDDLGAPLTTDQRGRPRVQGARCDVGAVEYESACTAGSALASAKLRAKKLDAGSMPGDERIVVSGSMQLTPAAAATFDPISRGAQVHVSVDGVPMFELTNATVPIPAGVAGSGCDPTDGWKTNAAGNKFVYKNRSGALPPACAPGSANGLRLVRFVLGVDGTLSVKVKAVDGTIAVPQVGDTFVRIVFGALPAASDAGDCGAVVFAQADCLIAGVDPLGTYKCKQ